MPHESRKAMIVPSLRYRDAPAAIEYLCEKFGFAKRLVIPGPDGTIRHAQLTLGDGMIMLGSAQNRDFGPHVKTPQELGANTQSAYVIVPEIDAHYAHAKAAGAEIVLEIAGCVLRGTPLFRTGSRGQPLALRVLRPLGGIRLARYLAHRLAVERRLHRPVQQRVARFRAST